MGFDTSDFIDALGSIAKACDASHGGILICHMRVTWGEGLEAQTLAREAAPNGTLLDTILGVYRGVLCSQASSLLDAT